MGKVYGLTQSMRDFCHEYLLCGNATEAYKKAYNCTSHTSASRNASVLLRRDDITEYIATLNKPMVNQITNEREKKRQIIWDRIEICLEKGDEAAIARYMDILNKMDAEYVNINRNIDDSSEKLAGLDTEQLKQILDGQPT